MILDVGNIIDMSWVRQFGDRISAILIAWLGGMESGNALCDVLFGTVSPSGKLPDTIAEKYTDYLSSAFFGGKKFNRYSEDIFVGYRYFDAHPE
ncbi:MAG: glycoside hydrolase family 3 C-terminal domain-containing protein, partial [Clostridia bacterium]|nr:glycoside hydrolase family 3 C-terminal domain-containing protein [Clostridia bacterium]